MSIFNQRNVHVIGDGPFRPLDHAPHNPWTDPYGHRPHQPWVSPYINRPPLHPKSPLNDFPEGFINKTRAKVKEQRKATSPINADAVFTAAFYSKLCEKCTDERLLNFFWVDIDYLVEHFNTGKYDAGHWFDNGVYVHRTPAGGVVFTTPVLQILYGDGIQMTIKQGKSLVITDEVIVDGLIPILTTMSDLLTPEQVSSSDSKEQAVPLKRRRKTTPTLTELAVDTMRKEIDTMVTDDNAMLLLDIPLTNLYNYLKGTPKCVLNLMAPSGQYVIACVDPFTSTLLIGCGLTTLHIPNYNSNLISHIDANSSNMSQTQELAAILSAIYIWKEANDIEL